MVYERQPKFCQTCGYQFASDPRANTVPRKKLNPVLAGCGCISVFVVVLLALSIYGNYTKSQRGSASTTNSKPAGQSVRAAPSGSPPQASTPSTAAVGDTVTVRKGNGFWPCGSTKEAFDELMKWSVRGDNDEIKRTMRITRSFALDGGMQVKVLDVGFGKRKVRVMTNDAGEAYLRDEQGTFPADPRIGRECWVVAEALSR
jgi:hypothetical protein